MKLLAVAALVLLFGTFGDAAPVCSVAAADRAWCGWIGISSSECTARGCCYESGANSINWCFQPAGVDPCATKPCRSDETCVSYNAATYTCVCPQGRVSVGGACVTPADSACVVDVAQRQNCGWKGISKDDCTIQGCCYEVNANTLNWCFRKAAAVDPCANNPCRPDESCIRSGAGYACTCPAGRTGTVGLCNKPADATCSAVAPDDRNMCGWFGISQADCAALGCCYEANARTTNFCYKKEVNPCASSPCLNGGACNKNGASYTCSCTAQWIGSNCNAPADPCAANPCKNGGACTKIDSTTFSCNCVPGWTGSNCNTEVNVCLQGNPCKNGGTCVKFGDSYECKCTPTWAGKNCDMGSATCSKITDRINCGWGGVTPAQCNERSCCFDDTKTSQGLSACFYSVNECDTMSQDIRADCGFDGISYWQCLGRGCCFNDDPDSNPGPVCYRKANPACIGVKAGDRVAKGGDNIEGNLCLASGWCYDSSAVPNCFVRKA